MGQLNLVAELEDAFDIIFEPEEMAMMKSYQDILSLVVKKKA